LRGKTAHAHNAALVLFHSNKGDELRAAVYIRMSTDDQTESPERQRSQVLPYCQRKGYEVVEVYEDLGMRGSDSSRPGFQRLLQDAEKGLFNIIVVDEQSRLSRDDPYTFFETVVPTLRRAGVSVDLVDQAKTLTWDRDDVFGLLVGAFGQYKASQESVSLGRRTATGMAKKAKEGKFFPGRAPYGYRYKKVDGARVGLEPDTDAPEKADVVRRIFDAYANRDQSLLGIVAELNSLGITSPQGRPQWAKHTVHHIITNPAYAGCYVWGKVPQGKFFRSDGGEIHQVGKRANKSERRPSEKWLILPGRHEPLVAPDLFDKVQLLLVANRPRTSPSRKKAKYPFAQLLRCSCRGPMYGTKRLSGGVWESVYRCGGDMVRKTCASRVVTERVVIEKLAEVLRQRLLDPVERERLEVEIHRQAEQQGGQDEKVLKDLRKKVEKLDAQIVNANKVLIRLDPENLPEAQNELRRLRQERATAQAELERLDRRSPTGSVEYVVDKVERLVEVMNSGDPDLVRSVVREAIAGIDLQFDTVPKKKVTRYPLIGGVVHLMGCADSDQSGPTEGR
jgi:site-specific DNA recombinase